MTPPTNTEVGIFASTKPEARGRILAVLDEAIGEGDELFLRSNRPVENPQEFPLVERITVALGSRVLNCLYAVRLLAPHGLDDQIAIICRSVVESAVDVAYLNETTFRTRGSRRVELTPSIKANLFATFKPLFIHSANLEEEDLGADAALPKHRIDELPPGYWEGVVNGRREALRLREKLGLGSSPYWAGVGNREMIAELRAAPGQNDDRLREIRRTFRDSSFYAHTSPNDQPYVVPETRALRVQFWDDGIVAESTMCGLEVFRRWAMVFGEDPESRLAPLMSRLRAELVWTRGRRGGFV
jgi:hypothetical protein